MCVTLSRANSSCRGRDGNGQVVEEPFVERPVVLEFQRGDRVGNVLDGIRLAMREIVAGVDFPSRSRCVDEDACRMR